MILTIIWRKKNILNISESFEWKLLCFGHKMKYDNQSLPVFFEDFYKNKDKLNLRNKKDFIIPFRRTRISQRSVDYTISHVWNKLLANIKNMSKYKSFIKTIKSHIFDKRSWSHVLTSLKPYFSSRLFNHYCPFRSSSSIIVHSSFIVIS